MSIWDIIPTCDNEMSVYTLCGFTILVAAWLLFTTLYTRYNSNEFRRIENWARDGFKTLEEKCSDHDEYIDNANSVINEIHVDLAVQKTSMKDIKDDIAEIKADLKTLLKR